MLESALIGFTIKNPKTHAKTNAHHPPLTICSYNHYMINIDKLYDNSPQDLDSYRFFTVKVAKSELQTLRTASLGTLQLPGPFFLETWPWRNDKPTDVCRCTQRDRLPDESFVFQFTAWGLKKTYKASNLLKHFIIHFIQSEKMLKCQLF